MCGIAGFINLKGNYSAEQMSAVVSNMAACMSHRGPDDFGVWIDPDNYCALSHRRLSIIDLSVGGHQPMESADGKAAITYNGEFYNYQDIKKELLSQGCQLKTEADTEVLLQKLLRDGERTLTSIDGMFAFGFFSGHSGELLLVRDPFGEKPLYFMSGKDFFAFASELTALSVVPGFDATICPEAIEQYLLFQYVQSPKTIYRGVSKLSPGHFLKLSRQGQIEIQKYFQFVPQANKFTVAKIEDLADELEEILVRSIKRRLISDVPLGAFLSGGVDSSTVVALCMKKLGRDIKTFSMGFKDTDETEHLYARAMAAHLGTEHHEKLIEPDMSAMALLIGRLLDEPNGDTSCPPTYLLSQFAREQVTVSLSGDGGDEMFGGYGRYFTTIEEEAQHAGVNQSQSWQAGATYLDQRILIFPPSSGYKLCGDMSPAVSALLSSYKSKLDRDNMPLIDKLRELDAGTYLPGAVLSKVDRMSMQHSLEVRTPFLNVELARFAEKIAPQHLYAQGQGKLVLKKLASKYIPLEWLQRKKMGFGLPAAYPGKDRVLNMANELILAPDGMMQEWLDKQELQKLLAVNGKQLSIYQLWPLVILEIWLRNHKVSLQSRRQSYFSGIRTNISNSLTHIKSLIASKG